MRTAYKVLAIVIAVEVAIQAMYVIPALALALLVVSFFTKLPGAVKWAGLVLLLVVLQVTLGLLGHSISVAGALHGLNALLLFSTAVYTAVRARSAGRAAAEAEPRTAAPA